jgi:hypothetical protein
MIAHAVTSNPTEKALFQNALVLEADWGLGRNPLNMVQMTTSTTSLGTKRSYENIYATGRNDGAPGVHPGLTPYQNTDDWGTGMIMSRPSWMATKCYPDYATSWPKSEGYFNSRYVYAHSEFTPQQTMRGKMALYGYLYGLYKSHTQTYSIIINVSHGTVQKSPDNALYNYGDTVTITLIPDPGHTFKNWSGDVSGTTNPIKVAMNSNKNITANFDQNTSTTMHEMTSVDIFPNPASDLFNIKLTGNDGETKLWLSDLNGKMILQKTISASLNQVNISELKQGIYVLRLNSRNDFLVSKLIVMRNQGNL